MKDIDNEKHFRYEAVCSIYIKKDTKKAYNYMMKIIKEKNINCFYRYRPAKDYEIDTLDKKQIYLCKPRIYEDNEDCEIKIDQEDLTRHLLEHNPLIYKVTDNFVNTVNEEIKKNPEYKELMDSMRNDCLVACFTQTYDNKYMWTNYASNATGICVEYDFKELLEFATKKELSYMPIRYVKDRNKKKDIYFTSKEFNLDKDTVKEAILKYKLSCMTKNFKPYYEEREWRLLSGCPKTFKKSTDAGMLYDFIKPKKVIMGKNTKENESFYKKICEYKEKNKDVEVIEYEKLYNSL